MDPAALVLGEPQESTGSLQLFSVMVGTQSQVTYLIPQLQHCNKYLQLFLIYAAVTNTPARGNVQESH